MKESGPQHVKRASAEMEEAAAELINLAQLYPVSAEAYQTRVLLQAGREYGRAVNALTRVRKRR